MVHTPFGTRHGGSLLFLFRLLHLHRDRIRVRDHQAVPHLHLLEVLRVPRGHRYGLPVLPLQGRGFRLLVDARDGGVDTRLRPDDSRRPPYWEADGGIACP